jgi:N utilization substance protein A
MSIKLRADEMRCIALFEGLTGAKVHDCIIHENGDRLTFVVKAGDIGLAIGKGGNNIRRAKHVIGKSIEVVKHSTDPVEFVKNTLMPARVKRVNIVERDGKKIALIDVEEEDRGIAIGRGGRRIQCAKKLVLRHHEIHDISFV